MRDCVNFMNQKAIDAVLQAANERLMEQDRHHGVENPESLYRLGTNCCVECRDSSFPISLPESPMVQVLQMVTSGQFHRLCYKPQLEARTFNRDSYGIWDNVEGDWVKGLFGNALTRNTLPAINRLLERHRVESR